MKETEEIDPRIKAIGRKLRKLRLETGSKNYEHFAFDHDLSRVQYHRIEKGTNFTITYFLKILDIHKLTLTEFFSDLDEYQKENND